MQSGQNKEDAPGKGSVGEKVEVEESKTGPCSPLCYRFCIVRTGVSGGRVQGRYLAPYPFLLYQRSSAAFWRQRTTLARVEKEVGGVRT